jgi:galactoside O-acetyltransferase
MIEKPKAKFVRRIRLVINPFFWFGKLHSLLCKICFKSCGSSFNAVYPLTIKGGGNIVIGNKFSSMGQDYLYADEGELIVGDSCSINTNVQVGASGGRVIIGDNVMIGPNVVIRASNHGFKRESSMRFQQHTFGEIIIEDDVWIGSNAVITSGVVLAKGTVVGAGAVVTKSTESYSIVGGVPARKIGERV